MKLRPIVLTAAILNSAFALQAADTPPCEFSLYPGIAFPQGTIGDSQKKSASLDASLLYRVTNWFAFGPEIGYIFGTNIAGDVPGTPANFTSEQHFDVTHYTLQFKTGPTLNSEDEIPIQPYIIAGAGYYHTHATDGTVTLHGRAANGFSVEGIQFHQDSANTDYFGINGGGGLAFQIGSRGAFAVEGRYHRAFGDDDVIYFIPAIRLTLFF